MSGQDRQADRTHHVNRGTGYYALEKYRWILLCAIVPLLSGCPRPKKIGPALTRLEMVNYYNANIAAVVPFKAGIFSWKAGWVDENGKHKSHGDLGGSIIYAA